MRPIASLLMRCGMTWKEFAELCKSVFVEVASEEYGIKGRKTNVSRTAILTGLSRKEVKRQRDLLDSQEPTTPSKTTDPTRVLAGWHQDKDFLDEQGRPRELVLDGGDGATFAELLRRYGGDIPSGAMLKELKIAKAVEETNSKKLRVTSRYYMPIQMEPELIVVAGSALQDLGTTLNNNVVPSSNQRRRFEGRAMNESIDARVVPAFRRFLDKQGQEFLEALDDWLTEHQLEGKTDKKKVRLGVGLYAIEDTTNLRGRK